MTKSQYRIDPQERMAFVVPDWSARPMAPKRVFLKFDTRDGGLEIAYEANSETGVSAAVYYGFVLRFPVPVTADADRFSEAINNGGLDALLARIEAGAEPHYDGNNHHCDLSADASEACEAVDRWISRCADTLGDSAGLWDAADWFADCEAADLGITDATTEGDLPSIADRLEEEALVDSAVLYGTIDYLHRLFDDVND